MGDLHIRTPEPPQKVELVVSRENLAEFRLIFERLVDQFSKNPDSISLVAEVDNDKALEATMTLAISSNSFTSVLSLMNTATTRTGVIYSLRVTTDPSENLQ